ncbi:MAG: thiolase family protein [Clostridiales bacterium]|nr:thiolase family protein [Clostridiales bacterium]
MKELREAVVVAYGRSAVGKAKKGYYVGIHPVEWAAETLEGVLAKVPALDPNEIDDVIVGCARTLNKCSKNVARLICLRAGLQPVSAQTVNRFCSSGLQSISIAANAIAVGDIDVAVAGGIECMSMTQTYGPNDDDDILDAMVPGAYMGMGITAENVAAEKGVTREAMDAFSVESHKKAAAAQAKGYLNKSIIPIRGKDAEGNEIIAEMDQGIRSNSTMESLGALKPCFKEDGLVTAGSSSQTNDAAAFVVLMSREKATALGLKPIARLLGFSTAGCAPETMGLGPIYAVPKVMARTGLNVKDMDVIELNEAFAAQSIPCIKELGMDPEKVNPWGGAIALGHPMGATGAFLTIKALDYLAINGGKYALITMCVGGGQGAAGIFEYLS